MQSLVLLDSPPVAGILGDLPTLRPILQSDRLGEVPSMTVTAWRMVLSSIVPADGSLRTAKMAAMRQACSPALSAKPARSW